LADEVLAIDGSLWGGYRVMNWSARRGSPPVNSGS